MGLLLIAPGMARPGFPGALWCEPCGELAWKEDLCRATHRGCCETCLLSPRYPRPGLRCGGRTYPCKLAQCVLQHFHSEDESPLCQDLAVSIAQIFPAVTRGGQREGQCEKP